MRRSAIVLATVALAACSMGNGSDADPGVAAEGTGDSRSYAVADFDVVELRGPDDVDVRVGSGFSVRAQGDPKVLDRLRIVREGQVLRIDRKPDRGWSLSGTETRVMVTMPRIARASVAGSGDLVVDRAEGERFDGAIAGSGGLSVAAMQVDDARLSIAGSGDLKAKGTATRLEVRIAGSGSIDAPALEAKRATVSIAGSGSVRAALDGEGEVQVAGSGDVDLGKRARCTIRKTGSGSVRCGG